MRKCPPTRSATPRRTNGANPWPATAPMRRSEVWWVSFAGSSGGEVRKTRPAVIVSNDAANQYANRLQVVPLSSKTDKLYPCEARVTVDGRESKAMADQIMTESKERLIERVGILSRHEMHGVD